MGVKGKRFRERRGKVYAIFFLSVFAYSCHVPPRHRHTRWITLVSLAFCVFIRGKRETVRKKCDGLITCVINVVFSDGGI